VDILAASEGKPRRIAEQQVWRAKVMTGTVRSKASKSKDEMKAHT
jgi:hypothetical protein